MRDSTPPEHVTGLLRAAEAGDRNALDELFRLVYDDLAVLAHRQRRIWDGDHTLNTTALVHEAYLKLTHQQKLPTESRSHFFAVAAKAMRHVLCNHARDRRTQKRGGGIPHVPLSDADRVDPGDHLSDAEAETLASLDAALRRLERIAERQARVVECRFFAGMSNEETAAALDISPRTVKRDWNFARAWLRREMQGAAESTDLVIPWADRP